MPDKNGLPQKHEYDEDTKTFHSTRLGIDIEFQWSLKNQTYEPSYADKCNGVCDYIRYHWRYTVKSLKAINAVLDRSTRVKPVVIKDE